MKALSSIISPWSLRTLSRPMSLIFGAVVLLGLQVDPVDLAVLVELVDVERAEVDLQGVEDVGQRDAARLGLDAVDVEIALRHVAG